MSVNPNTMPQWEQEIWNLIVAQNGGCKTPAELQAAIQALQNVMSEINNDGEEGCVASEDGVDIYVEKNSSGVFIGFHDPDGENSMIQAYTVDSEDNLMPALQQLVDCEEAQLASWEDAASGPEALTVENISFTPVSAAPIGQGPSTVEIAQVMAQMIEALSLLQETLSQYTRDKAQEQDEMMQRMTISLQVSLDDLKTQSIQLSQEASEASESQETSFWLGIVMSVVAVVATVVTFGAAAGAFIAVMGALQASGELGKWTQDLADKIQSGTGLSGQWAKFLADLTVMAMVMSVTFGIGGVQINGEVAAQQGAREAAEEAAEEGIEMYARNIGNAAAENEEQAVGQEIENAEQAAARNPKRVNYSWEQSKTLGTRLMLLEGAQMMTSTNMLGDLVSAICKGKDNETVKILMEVMQAIIAVVTAVAATSGLVPVGNLSNMTTLMQISRGAELGGTLAQGSANIATGSFQLQEGQTMQNIAADQRNMIIENFNIDLLNKMMTGDRKGATETIKQMTQMMTYRDEAGAEAAKILAGNA